MPKLANFSNINTLLFDKAYEQVLNSVILKKSDTELEFTIGAISNFLFLRVLITSVFMCIVFTYKYFLITYWLSNRNV